MLSSLLCLLATLRKCCAYSEAVDSLGAGGLYTASLFFPHHLCCSEKGPLERLRTLHHLVGGCLSQSNETPRLHGGQVASHIYSFLHHGDPQRRELVSNILR